MFAKLFFWPVEISNESLQSVQLPEEVLGRARAVTAEQPQLNQCHFIKTEIKIILQFTDTCEPPVQRLTGQQEVRADHEAHSFIKENCGFMYVL